MNRVRMNFQSLAKLLKRAQFYGLMCLALVTGCGDDGGTPVKIEVAQQILASVMEGWHDGKTPEDFGHETPAIVVHEMEWSNGAELLDFQIINDDQPTGPNLVATVKLKLKSAEGKVTEKTATYIVGTSPTLTIYRNTMR